jgi:SAM-dependent methyltransferase
MHRNKLEVTFNDFPNFVLNNSEAFTSIVQFNNLITLAEKWELAAEIFHSDDESGMMESLLRSQIPANAKVLDAACGTGHNSFILQSMGDMNYNLTASDKDPNNLEIFKGKIAKAGIEIPSKLADWNNLVSDLGGEKFDAITCLGSSIPYYKSWKEDGNGYEFTQEGITHVLSEFKSSLNMNGKLFIGLSRYINKGLTETNLKFKRKKIEESIVGAQDSEYDMSWYFKYDWSEKRKRIWDCHIKNDFGDDYSFRLVSHLFDIDELVFFCEEVFGKGNVERRDLHSTSYDMFVICKNVATDEPANS